MFPGQSLGTLKDFHRIDHCLVFEKHLARQVIPNAYDIISRSTENFCVPLESSILESSCVLRE